MKYVYGLKTLELSDITNSVCGNPLACREVLKNSYLIDEFDIDEKYIINTEIGGNLSIFNLTKPYVFVCIPIELFEQKIITSKIVSEIEKLSPLMLSVHNRHKTERMKHNFQNSYNIYSGKSAGYATSEKPSYVFIYLDDKLIDVKTSIPKHIEGLLLRSNEYKCCECGFVSSTDNTTLKGFLPDMYYKVYENNVLEYKCSKCKTDEFRHVGD